MQVAQTWTVIGMGFGLFSWLLVQMRGVEKRVAEVDQRVGDVDRRVSDGFVEMARQLGEVNGQLAKLRADLRIHRQRDH